MELGELRFVKNVNIDDYKEALTNELRLGNYVYCVTTDAEVVIVGDIYSDETINYKECNFEGYIGSTAYSIRLNEKWLIYFGFVWNESWGCYIKNGYLVEKIGDLLLDRKYGKVIKYVHQLQNLYFLLTDKELV